MCNPRIVLLERPFHCLLQLPTRYFVFANSHEIEKSTISIRRRRLHAYCSGNVIAHAQEAAYTIKMSATLTWKREDIVYCRCSDMRSVHSHCPCGMCNGSAVSRSTEYRHWEIATKCASNLAFTSTASPSSSLVIPEMPMCIPNVVSDDKTMSGDELEACSSEIATVANSNQSSPFTTATDCGDVETMLEAEDFCAGGIECTLQNEDGSFPIENVERMQGTVVDHKVKCIIREAVLGAMKIQSEFSSSRAHFLRVLNYGRDLFCKGDPNIIKYWPKTWQDCISLLSGEGYTEAIQYWICLNREHPCCYDITNSPEELCK